MKDILRIPEVIVALDFNKPGEALDMVDTLEGKIGFYKIGGRLFTAEGPGIVREIKEKGKAVFLDLKYHDIPATVAGSVRAAAGIGIDMLTLHTVGGVDMMRAAAEAALEGAECFCKPRPKLVGVTVLTSLTEGDLEVIGPVNGRIADLVLRLASRAREAGLDGVVASVHEADVIRKELGSDFLIVTPGIRPAGADAGDQKRIATPSMAAEAGADYIVVGRPIIRAESPADAAEAIVGDLEGRGKGCGKRP